MESGFTNKSVFPGTLSAFSNAKLIHRCYNKVYKIITAFSRNKKIYHEFYRKTFLSASFANKLLCDIYIEYLKK